FARGAKSVWPASVKRHAPAKSPQPAVGLAADGCDYLGGIERTIDDQEQTGAAGDRRDQRELGARGDNVVSAPKLLVHRDPKVWKEISQARVAACDHLHRSFDRGALGHVHFLAADSGAFPRSGKV